MFHGKHRVVAIVLVEKGFHHTTINFPTVSYPFILVILLEKSALNAEYWQITYSVISQYVYI